MARWSHTGCSLGVLLPDSLAPMQGEQEVCRLPHHLISALQLFNTQPYLCELLLGSCKANEE